jgi:hypothetical protein
MAGKGKFTVFISTYESRKYVAMILDVQKLIATYLARKRVAAAVWRCLAWLVRDFGISAVRRETALEEWQ